MPLKASSTGLSFAILTDAPSTRPRPTFRRVWLIPGPRNESFRTAWRELWLPPHGPRHDATDAATRNLETTS
jgi:hypothetical protein